MYKVKFISVAVMLATVTTAMAGGILTNTNQSVEFLKNPARDAAIGLDGVYSNPAGVVFMPEGFHLAINWQYAHLFPPFRQPTTQATGACSSTSPFPAEVVSANLRTAWVHSKVLWA